jgi:hypothetical protein
MAMTTERAVSGGSRSQVSAGAQCYHPGISGVSENFTGQSTGEGPTFAPIGRPEASVGKSDPPGSVQCWSLEAAVTRFLVALAVPCSRAHPTK